MDYEMIQEIGKYEDSKAISDVDRVTSWYGDYAMYEPKLGVEDEKILERYNEIQGELGVPKIEPAKDPFLKDCVWTHYSDGSGSLCRKSDGERLAQYDLNFRELKLYGEYFYFYDEPEFSLKVIMEKAEECTVERIRCNTIGAYETEHKLPDNVRLTKWDPLLENYLRLYGVEDEKLQQRYDQIINNTMKKQVQFVPMRK